MQLYDSIANFKTRNYEGSKTAAHSATISSAEIKAVIFIFAVHTYAKSFLWLGLDDGRRPPSEHTQSGNPLYALLRCRDECRYRWHVRDAKDEAEC